jgi:hypothetical protein
MRPIIEGPPGPDDPRPPLLRRLLWAAVLIALSRGVTAGVAYLLRWLIL